MEKKFIVDGKLCLYEFIMDSEPLKIENGVILNQFPDGECYVHSWEPSENHKNLVSFSIDDSRDAKVYDWELESYQEKIEIEKPRGMGWVFRYGKWEKPWN